jgi:hypothetical protein
VLACPTPSVVGMGLPELRDIPTTWYNLKLCWTTFKPTSVVGME